MQDLKSFLNEHKTHAGCLLDILGDPSQDPGLKKHAALLDFLEEDLPENAARVLLKYRKFPPKAREEKKRLILELGLLIQDCLEKNGITADFLRDLTAPGNRIANAVSGNEKRSGIRTTEGRVFLRAGTDVKFRNTAFGDLAGMPFFPKSAEFAREVSELSQIVVAENQAVFFDFESLTVLAEDSGTSVIADRYRKTLFVHRVMPAGNGMFSESEYCNTIMLTLLRRFPEIPVIMAGDPDPGGFGWMTGLYSCLSREALHGTAPEGGILLPEMTPGDWDILRKNGKDLRDGEVFEGFKRKSEAGKPDSAVTALLKTQFDLRKTITEEYLRARKIPLRLYPWEELLS